MNTKLIASPLIGLLAQVGVVASAEAQQEPSMAAQSESRDYFTQRVPAPRRALELSVGAGYTQGFGSLQRGIGMPDVATPGLAVDLGAAYRIDPHWGLGLAGQYQELNAERAATARGLATGIAGAYHIAPYVRSDPWLALGVGYRMLWENQDSPASATLLTHGFQLAKLSAGLDLRFTEDVAIAPVVGADLNVFLWQDGGAGTVAIADPRLSTFVFLGAQGRFDVAASHESGESTASTASR